MHRMQGSAEKENPAQQCVLQKRMLFCNAVQPQICHCEEGKAKPRRGNLLVLFINLHCRKVYLSAVG